MIRFAVMAVALTLTCGLASAEDKKDPKAKSEFVSWEGGANGVTIQIDVGKEKLKIQATVGCNGTTATCKYTADKDGVVMAEVTDVEVKGNFPYVPKKGLKFSFKWKVDGDTATLSDLKGKDIEDHKEVIEGKYTKKK